MTEIRIINDLDENVIQYIFYDISILQSYLFIAAMFDCLCCRLSNSFAVNQTLHCFIAYASLQRFNSFACSLRQ